MLDHALEFDRIDGVDIVNLSDIWWHKCRLVNMHITIVGRSIGSVHIHVDYV